MTGPRAVLYYYTKHLHSTRAGHQRHPLRHHPVMTLSDALQQCSSHLWISPGSGHAALSALTRNIISAVMELWPPSLHSACATPSQASPSSVDMHGTEKRYHTLQQRPRTMLPCLAPGLVSLGSVLFPHISKRCPAPEQ